MTRQFQIKDGVVHAVWQGNGPGPPPPDDSWDFVDVTDKPDVTPVCLYDRSTKQFTPPAPPPDYGIRMEPRDFFMLFPAAVRRGLRTAADTNDEVRDILELILMPQTILTKHPRVVKFLTRLVQLGHLTAPDAQRISRGETTAQE